MTPQTMIAPVLPSATARDAIPEGTAAKTTVQVLICTYRRAHLAQTLASLGAQDLPDGLLLSVVVADNDTTPSAADLIARARGTFPYPLRYLHAPARNISIARNAGLALADADWVAFLDDDETAPPGWIAALLARAHRTGADAVFGPAIAIYPPGAPRWMVALDLHSNRPERRHGRVLTGHTCNALLRWRGTPWQGLRFDPARGRSGGEDTAFFFAAARIGARFEAAPDAPVHEDVAPSRLRFGWLVLRRYRMGQSHVSSARGLAGRLGLAAGAAAKAAVCGAAALLTLPVAERRNFWALRGALHLGVIAGCLRLPQPQPYGR